MPQDQDVVTLTNCDREPIHLLGSIQPIGFLLSVSTDWRVLRASANVEAFLGLPASKVVGDTAAGILGTEPCCPL